jgi:(S)-2-hydroxyglutarate dehydrogenase
MNTDADIAAIGGSIVGLSAAMHLLERYPRRPVRVLEKETCVASRQTGQNSGVVHAGVYAHARKPKWRHCPRGKSGP